MPLAMLNMKNEMHGSSKSMEMELHRGDHLGRWKSVISLVARKLISTNSQILFHILKQTNGNEKKRIDLIFITFALPPPGTCPMFSKEFTLDFAFLLKSIFFVSIFTPPNENEKSIQN